MRTAPIHRAAFPATHPLAEFDRGTRWHLLKHYVAETRIEAQLHIEPSPAGTEDAAIAARVLDAFLAMLDAEANTIDPTVRAGSGIWEMMRHEFHGQLYAHAANRDVAGLAETLRNAMRHPVTHGLGPGAQVFATLSTPEGMQETVLIILDRLASLAEALGVLPYENPEQGRYGRNVALDPSAVVASVEARLGYRIGRAPVMGAFGLRVADQVIDVRAPDDAYAADRLQSLLRSLGREEVAEIGGGLGGTALQAYRAGLSRYTMFDLPLVLMLQAWLLIKTCGPASVALFGEAESSAPLRLRPYWEFADRSRPFDLVFNRDSLPEIPRRHAAAYVAELADRGCALLSINQESEGFTDDPAVAQLRVSDLVADEPGLVRVHRAPYWIRRGYLEELFVPAGAIRPSARPMLLLPPEPLRERVAGTADPHWFAESGRRTVAEWRSALDGAGEQLESFGTVLDFGCGCGRTLLVLAQQGAPGQQLIGVDTDREAVAWVAAHLDGVRALAIDPLPPIPLDTGSVDLVLSHSVFSHLPEDSQHAWLAELARLLRPGGVAVLSIHGARAEGEFLKDLRASGQGAMAAEVVRALDDHGYYYRAGKSAAEASFPDAYGAAFHRVGYVVRHWLDAFDLVRYLPSHALALQDVVVLRRRGAGEAVT